MTRYDSRFEPPAPLVLVVLKSQSLGISIQNVPMLLDSGADISLVPQALAAQFVLPDSKEYEMEAFNGSKSFAKAIDAEIELLGKTFQGQFVISNTWYGILGRNVLNNLSLQFDGPSLRWGESARAK